MKRFCVLALVLFVGNSFAEEVGLYCESLELKESGYTLENGKFTDTEPFRIQENPKEIFLILNSSNKTIEEIYSFFKKHIKKVPVSETNLNTYDWNHIFNLITNKDKTYQNFKNSPDEFDSAFLYSIDRESLELKVTRLTHFTLLNYGYVMGTEFRETYQCEIANKKVFEEKESALEEIKSEQDEQKSKNKI